jgi:hypothetical protein
MYPASLDSTFTPSSTDVVCCVPAGVALAGQMLHGCEGVHEDAGGVVLKSTSTQ